MITGKGDTMTVGTLIQTLTKLQTIVGQDSPVVLSVNCGHPKYTGGIVRVNAFEAVVIPALFKNGPEVMIRDWTTILDVAHQ